MRFKLLFHEVGDEIWGWMRYHIGKLVQKVKKRKKSVFSVGREFLRPCFMRSFSKGNDKNIHYCGINLVMLGAHFHTIWRTLTPSDTAWRNLAHSYEIGIQKVSPK